MVDGPVLVGAGGRVYFREWAIDNVAPTYEVFDSIPDTIEADGWTAAGIIHDDGVEFSDEKTIQKIMGWREKRPVRKLATDRSTVVSFRMRQWNAENLIFAMGGGSFDGNGTYTPSEDVSLPDMELIVFWDDDDDEFAMWLPKGVTGANITFNLKKDENIALPIEFEVTSDEEDDNDIPFYIFTNSETFGSES